MVSGARPCTSPARVGLCLVCIWWVTVPALTGRRQDWIEIASPHFHVVTNAGKRGGKEVALQFERIRMVFEKMFPEWRLNPGKPFVIFAARDFKTMRELLPQYWERDGVRPSGIFKMGEERHYAVVLAKNGEETYRTVFHEFTHMLTKLNFPFLPLWLHEGLADFIESVKIHPQAVDLGRPEDTHANLLFREDLIPLEAFFAVDQSSPIYRDPERVHQFYAQAWALTHYLLMSPAAQERGLLGSFLNQSRRHVPPAVAVKWAFGDLDELANELRGYISQNRYRFLRVSTPISLTDKDFSVMPLSRAQGWALKGAFFVAENQLGHAFSALKRAEELDSGLPALFEGWGLYYFKQENFAKALAAFEASLAREEHNLVAHYFIGRILCLNPMDPATLVRAERHLRRSLAIEPEFSSGYSELGWCLSFDEARAEQALAMVKRAMTLEKGNLLHWGKLYDCLMQLGKTDEAIQTAQALLHYAGHEKAREEVRRLVERALDQKKRVEALERAPLPR